LEWLCPSIGDLAPGRHQQHPDDGLIVRPTMGHPRGPTDARNDSDANNKRMDGIGKAFPECDAALCADRRRSATRRKKNIQETST